MTSEAAVLSPIVQAPLVRGLFSNMVTLGGAEMVNRVTRLATAVALGWALSPPEFGLAAIALTASDILRALTQTGIGARIISVEETALEETCNTAYRLNWWVYGGVALLQAAAAYPVAYHFGDLRIAGLMLAFALPYLLYPMVAVQVYRMQRQQRMRETAVMLVVLLSGDNLLTALLAAAGFGIWSLALPKLICALAWVVMYRRMEKWRPGTPVAPVKPLLTYGLAVMASELTAAFRLHADKLIIGQVLGITLLGQYFFAFNAGLGMTSAFVSAAATALLPHYSGHQAFALVQRRFLKGTGLLALLIIPVIAAQTLLAPIYIPLVFGAKWNEAIPLLMLLCWLALPLLLSRSTSLLLRARGLAGLEFKLTMAQATVAIAALSAGLPFGLQASILAQIVVAGVAAVAATVIALRACTQENTR
ncbi:MAG: oligosaccharide flippase family protein [Rhizobiales bacterium]|nr:oligosaccharide flippase family protein [Hyphomicrobiales bacterium]